MLTNQRAKNARSQAALTAAHAKARLRQLGMRRVESYVIGCLCGSRAQAFVLFDHKGERVSVGIEVDGGRGVDPRVHAHAMVYDVLALLEIPIAR
jgi:hypothetical protein